jgi:hypothetical protein
MDFLLGVTRESHAIFGSANMGQTMTTFIRKTAASFSLKALAQLPDPECSARPRVSKKKKLRVSRDLEASASGPVVTCRLKVALSVCGHWGLKKINPRCSSFNSDSLPISWLYSVTQSDFVSAHCR